MTGYVVPPFARQDILEITDYISAENLNATLRLRDRLFGAFELVGQRPGVRHVRDDLVLEKQVLACWSHLPVNGSED